MDKAQAIHQFWNAFTWDAYDEFSVPEGSTYPYITYNVSTDSIGRPIPLTASLWDRGSSWERVTKKAQEISDYIGYGHQVEEIDDGYMYIVRGSTFAQRMNDPNDGQVKRIYLNIMVEFLTP